MLVYSKEKLFKLWKESNWETIDYVLRDRFEEVLQYAFEEAFESGDYCENCEYAEIEYDPYNTGDSPTYRDCHCHLPERCDYVIDHAPDIFLENLWA